MKRKHTRTQGDRFCTVRIELENGRLSISGSEGRIVTRAAAKREALDYWISFFEDSPEEIHAMNQKCGKRFTSARGAAKYVLECDGEHHGLDVEVADDGHGRTYILESCGQGTIRKFFPELAPLLPWHLNDMHAGCEHQDGWKADDCGKPCPTCGYKYGSQWLKRELPPEIVTLATEWTTGGFTYTQSAEVR